jgi:predicted GNAT family N-acyltransferase
VQLAAFREGRLAGALRINFSHRGSLHGYDHLYGISGADLERRVMLVTKLVTKAEHRGSGYTSPGVELACEAYRYSLRAQARGGVVIDCNPPLTRFFEWLGFDAIRAIDHPEYGEVMVMKLDPWDRRRLLESGSPFCSIWSEEDGRYGRSQHGAEAG